MLENVEPIVTTHAENQHPIEARHTGGAETIAQNGISIRTEPTTRLG